MTKRLFLYLTIALLSALTSGPLEALSVERETAAQRDTPTVRWSAGALAGGDIRALAIHPDDPEILLAGTATGQIYRSTDGADSWALAAESAPFRGWVVSNLMFDLESPATVWAAMRGILSEEGFVARSLDGGTTWEYRSYGLPGRQVYALAQSRGRIYAGTRLGVWGSTDGGESWSQLTEGYPEIQKVTSLLVDPEDPDRVFAGTWRRAYRSDDGGVTWSGVFEGMVLDSEVFSLQAVPDSPGELWASTCGWVYRGRGSGEAWQRLTNGLAERRTPSFLVLDRASMLAGTVAGVYRTDDTGSSWRRVTPEDLVALTIESHPRRSDRVFVATEGAGVWRSVDGGESFQPANRGLYAARIASVTALNGEVMVAVRHAGPASGVYSSFDGGRTYLIGPVRLPSIVQLASDGQSVFAGTSEGLWERKVDGWEHVERVGDSPVRQVVAAGDSVAVRTDRGIYVRWQLGEQFEHLEFDRGRAASVALDHHGVWVSAAAGGLFLLTESGVVPTASPIGTGHIYAAGGRLLIAGSGQLWQRPGLDAAWEELGRRLTFHPTGSEDYPVLLVDGEGEGRLLSAGDRAERLFGLDIPARDLSAVLMVGDRLVLGTSGYGLLVGDLPMDVVSTEPSVAPSAR